METQGISVDSQVLIDASNTLKVNAFSPLQWNNSLLWISIILTTFGVYRAKVFLFFFFADENTKGRRRGPQGKVKVW